jgi:signal transduction histidine kinase
MKKTLFIAGVIICSNLFSQQIIYTIKRNQPVFPKYSLNLEELKELTPLLALNLFRISQEALTNVLKYANASKVEIQISSRSIIIQDDGQGFDFQTIKKGYGLTNMESRAKEFNGTFHISSSNKGTKIRIAFES